MPNLDSVVVCHPGQSIRDLQSLLIESTTNFVIVSDASGEKVFGVVTLHDLLRAEVQKASSGGE